jgi:hypothetical protein
MFSCIFLELSKVFLENFFARVLVKTLLEFTNLFLNSLHEFFGLSSLRDRTPDAFGNIRFYEHQTQVIRLHPPFMFNNL